MLNRHAKGCVNIETHAGVSAATMPKDRFQVQVAIIPPKMLPTSGNESEASMGQSYSGDLANNFKVSLEYFYNDRLIFCRDGSGHSSPKGLLSGSLVVDSCKSWVSCGF